MLHERPRNDMLCTLENRSDCPALHCPFAFLHDWLVPPLSYPPFGDPDRWHIAPKVVRQVDEPERAIERPENPAFVLLQVSERRGWGCLAGRGNDDSAPRKLHLLGER